MLALDRLLLLISGLLAAPSNAAAFDGRSIALGVFDNYASRRGQWTELRGESNRGEELGRISRIS